ncbi:MAG: CHAT domain-containing protein [Cyanothece sp. SIO1E1]|nr:CHAT domain-containing protein [Cyanothece sp. SIO1E1]
MPYSQVYLSHIVHQYLYLLRKTSRILLPTLCGVVTLPNGFFIGDAHATNSSSPSETLLPVAANSVLDTPSSKRGDIQKRFNLWQETFVHYQQQGDLSGILTAILALGENSLALGEHQNATTLYKYGLATLQTLNNFPASGDSLITSLDVDGAEKSTDAYELAYSESEPVLAALKINDRQRRLDALNHLARSYLRLQDYQQTYQIYHHILEQTQALEVMHKVNPSSLAKQHQIISIEKNELGLFLSEDIQHANISFATSLEIDQLHQIKQFIDLSTQSEDSQPELQVDIHDLDKQVEKQKEGRWEQLQQAYLLAQDSSSSCASIEVLEEKITCYDKALDVAMHRTKAAINTRNRNGEAIALIDMGIAYLGLEKPTEAIPRLKLASEIFQDLNDKSVNYAIALEGLANTYSFQNEYAKAIDSYSNALLIYQEENRFGDEFRIRGQLAEIYRLTEDIEKEVIERQKLARVAYSLEQNNEAIEAYKRVQNIYYASGRSFEEAGIWSLLGDIYLNDGEYINAQTAFMAAGDLYKAYRKEHPYPYIEVLIKLGQVYIGLETDAGYKESLTISEKALALIEKYPDSYELPEGLDIRDLLILRRQALDNIGNAYLGQERYDDAFLSLQEASEVTGEISNEIDRRLGRWPQHFRVVGALTSLLDFVLPGSSFLMRGVISLTNGADQFLTAANIGAKGISFALSELTANEAKDLLEQAADAFEELRENVREQQDYGKEVEVLLKLGNTYLELQEYKKADKAFEDALEIQQQELVEQPDWAASAFLGRSKSQYAMGEYDEAQKLANKALAHYQKLGLRGNIGSARSKLILSSISLGSGGDYEQARSYANDALSLFEKVEQENQGDDYRAEKANLLLTLSEIDLQVQQYNVAITNAEIALDIFKNLRDPGGRADSLLTLSNAYLYLGQYFEALERARIALLLYRQIDDRAGETRALNVIGTILQNQRRFRQATESLELSLVVQEQIAEVRPKRGLINKFLSGVEGAFNIFRSILIPKPLSRFGGPVQRWGYRVQQFLTATRTFVNLAEGASTYLGLGSAHLSRGDYQQAIESYKKAHKIAKRQNNKSGRANALLGLSNTKLSFERGIDKAQKYAKKALKIYLEISDSSGEGYALLILSQLHLHLATDENLDKITQDKYSQEALDYNQRALAIFKNIGDSQGQALAFSVAGDIQFGPRQDSEQGRDIAAIAFYKESIRLIEEIRRGNQTLPEKFQRSYLSTVAETYRKLADLLLSEGRILEAQKVLELLKIEELRGYNPDQRAAGHSIDFTLLKAEKNLIDKYDSLSNAAKRLDYCGISSDSCPEKDREFLSTQFQELQSEFKEEIQKLYTEVIRRRCNARRFIGIEGLDQECIEGNIFLEPNDLGNEAQKIIEAQPNTLLIYPFVLEDKLWLLWAGKDIAGIKEIKISREELSNSVLEFRSLLKERSPKPRLNEVGGKLYELLIRPLEDELKTQGEGVKHLVFALDQVTRYIPMAALFDLESNKYLIEKNYTITTILSAALTDFNATLPKNVQEANILAAGVVSTPNTDFSSLKHVNDEIKKIVIQNSTVITDTVGIYPGFELLNEQVTFEAISDKLFWDKSLRFLHIATHGEFIPTKEGESYLLMGDGDPLFAPKIKELSNLVNNIHLVVLSACETGLGGPEDDGVEIAGINSYFLQGGTQGGAKAVLGTLWKVSDFSTSSLMQEFYTNLKQGNMTKAEALRLAQLCLLNGETGCSNADVRKRSATGLRLNPDLPESIETEIDVSHPYYWAPFVLTGNGL